MKKVYIAEDGTQFDNEQDCIAYEKVCVVKDKLAQLVGSKYDEFLDMWGCLDLHVVANFIFSNFDQISKIINQTESNWISNDGNDTPYSPIPGNSLIQVKYRNGKLDTGIAESWSAGWRSTDRHFADIVEYRILNDGEWISNENNLTTRPPIADSMQIEVKYRCGSIQVGIASEWSSSWRCTDNNPLDIVEYRILKASE